MIASTDQVLRMVWPLVGRSSEMHRLEGILGEPLPCGLLISGQMGVGKSRLLAELTARASRAGWAVERIAGNISSSQVPMGALAPLLPDPRSPGLGSVVFQQQVRRALAEKHRGSRLLLAVDDAHSLDPASALFVAQWAALGYCFVACTARSEETLPAPLLGIAKDRVISIIDIRPLRDEAIEHLIRAALDGQIDGTTCRQLVEVVAGNPLFLREVLDHSIETASLQLRDGCWQLASPLSMSPTLSRLLHQRLGRLTSEQYDTLELISLAHPLELEVLDEASGEVIVDLERRNIISVSRSGRRRMVTFGHPLFAEALRSSIPQVQRRRLSGTLLHRLQDTGARRREDPLRIGIWHTESGEGVAVQHLAAAAQCANTAGEHVLAERLARTAVEAGATTQTQILLADSISRQGRVEEAEVRFSTIAERVAEASTRMNLALLRAENAGMRGGEIGQGIRILDDARTTCDDPVSQALLDSHLVLLHAFRPDLERATSIAHRLIEAAGTPTEARVSALMNLALILIWQCNFDEAFAAVDQADRLATEGFEELSPDLWDRIQISTVAVWPWAGNLERALPKLRSGYQKAFAPPIGDYAGFWAHFLGQALRMSGAVIEAAEVGRSAVRLIDRVDPTGSRAMVYAQQAINLGQIEDSAGIEDMIARLHQEPPGPPPRAAWPLIAEGWSRAVDGDIPAAMDLLCRAGNAALEDGLPVIAAWALYDTVRWGASQQSGELLRRTADQTTSRTINAVADHAAALLARDPARLEWIASDYATRAENLNATLAYSQAAQLYQESGSNVRATRAITKAHVLASDATQLDLPRCAAVHNHLTTRESEVANLAARSLSSKEIARRLYISVRTVDNHLASAYVKLGVHSRSELGDAIIPPA